MKTASTLREKKVAVVRARCDENFKNILERVCKRLGLDQSDVLRLGVMELASRTVGRGELFHAQN